MQPPLYTSLANAFARTHRAQHHMAQIERELTSFWSFADLPDARETDHGMTGTFTFITGVLVPDILSILIGECIYNLRAALDYLVYELAILDSGQIQDGTQFPIESTPARFESRRNTYLKGLSDEHKEMIKTLQPFPERNWTSTLQSVSNPDKHRTLTIVNPSQRVDYPYSDARPDYYLSFDDGSPVIPTLQDLHVQINNVLDSINVEFTIEIIRH